MKEYFSNEHIEILNSILPHIPKYDTFSLQEISKIVSEIDRSYSDEAYLLSKFTGAHGNLLTELWLNGLIEFTDKEKGICKFTSDGHKLKDIGNYRKYLNQLNGEYRAKRSESFIKTYWWIPTLISFLLGAISHQLLNPAPKQNCVEVNSMVKEKMKPKIKADSLKR